MKSVEQKKVIFSGFSLEYRRNLCKDGKNENRTRAVEMLQFYSLFEKSGFCNDIWVMTDGTEW